MTDLSSVLSKVDSNLEDALARLFDLVSIPSISSDPAHSADVARAADWLADELEDLGFTAEVHPTPGHPVVVGHAEGATKAPHVVFYGHYDVQPVDPLELWDNPPFSPKLEVVGGVPRILGRGTADDKGQLMTFIEAVRAFRETGTPLPCPITVVLEGEEEAGSSSLPAFLEAHRDELAHDIVLICDTNMIDGGIPAVTTMLRGVVPDELTITGPNRDLHSGYFGGAAINPLHVLAKLLADLHDDSGRVTIPGFYDGVDPVPESVAADWKKLPISETEFLGAVGLATPAGEQGYSLLHQIWARPTAEVNGMWGGYTGPGGKTVIPSQAHAKLSFRLVGRQDPGDIIDKFRAYVRDTLPKDCTVEFGPKHESGPAVVVPPDNPWLVPAKAALSEEWGTPAMSIGSGGSIPIVGAFKKTLGMDSLLIGFSYDEDRIHSPNEKYDLANFHKGIRSWVRILDAFRGRGESQVI